MSGDIALRPATLLSDYQVGKLQSEVIGLRERVAKLEKLEKDVRDSVEYLRALVPSGRPPRAVSVLNDIVYAYQKHERRNADSGKQA